jgi:hypothetical protein
MRTQVPWLAYRCPVWEFHHMMIVKSAYQRIESILVVDKGIGRFYRSNAPEVNVA